MLRYFLLSISCLIVLTGCFDGLTGQAGGENPAVDDKTELKTEDKPKAAMACLPEVRGGPCRTNPTTSLLDKGPIAREVGEDVVQFLNQRNPQSCSKCDLVNANLKGAILYKTDLTKATLTDANLFKADLTGANLADANLTRAILNEGILYKADLTKATLIDANLSRADLTGANLVNANLKGAMLYETDLTRANLKDTNLFNVDLTKADLTGASLKGANMAGAILYDVIGADFSGALNVPKKK